MKSNWSPLIWVSLLFGLGMPGAAQAQQSGTTPPAKSAATSTDASAKPAAGIASRPAGIENDPALMVTDEQKARIKAIRDDAELQVQAAEKDTALTDEQKERRIKQIHKETRAKVFAVLTPDQQKTWGAEQHERHEARSSKPKPE
ncbi:MAG: hypothetical protein ACRD5M_07300 [Candidatus Acidiferrales bacterium]